jgi:hypothetical protein
MKKTIERVLFLTLFLTLSFPAFSYDLENPQITPLYTQANGEIGQIPIGEIHLWNDSDQLHIKFRVIHPDWQLARTHVQIICNHEGIYQRKSLLHSTRYEVEEFHPSIREFTHRVNINWVAPKELLITAEAEVCPIHGYTSDVIGLIETLPETVTMSVIQPSPDKSAYFQATIVDDDILAGFHRAWCVDLDRHIDRRTWHNANVYSIYEELPLNFLEFPENLDLVNWILNKGFVGKFFSPRERYTFGDIQRTIWELLDNQNAPFNLGRWSQNRSDAILDEAQANGEGYIPGCNQRLLLVLLPVDETQEITAQAICITIPVPSIPVVHKATARAQIVYPSENKWGTSGFSPVIQK